MGQGDSFGDSRLALSLSSAFLGFYTHAGFLQGLVEAGVWPGHLAGASSGAMVAAFAGVGMRPKEMLDFMLSRAFRLGFFEIGMMVGLPYWPIYRRRYSGAARGEKMVRVLKQVLGERRVESCEGNLGIAVTNLTALRAEIREAGPLAELVVASCAYPTLVSHQIVGGEALWDGGVAQSPPFIHWAGREEVRQVLLHQIGEPERVAADRLGISSAFALAHDVIGVELMALRRHQLEAEGKELQVMVTQSRRPPWLVSERRGRLLFEEGRRSGLAAIALLGRTQDGGCSSGSRIGGAVG